MDRTDWMRRLHAARLPLAALAAGLLLLLLAGRGADKQEPEAEPVNPSAEDRAEIAETRLEAILHEIDGVGETHVLLSFRTSEQTEYVSDADETVILSAGSGKQSALIRLTRYPEYLGAVVVCEGGDNASVRLNVIQAVTRFTGLRADSVTVLKLRE